MFHMQKARTATIRELRTDFRVVKQRIEQYGQIVITDRGQPAYVIMALREEPQQQSPLPDYYSRLRERQPTPLSVDATQQFWDEERA